MKILNFGSCNIDYVYSMEHAVRVGETLSAEKMEIFPGGKGLNQSLAIARAGAKVYHAGCVGRDGGMLKELLEESGVDVSYLRSVDAPNGHAIIQLDSNGNNCIVIYGGSNDMVTRELIDDVLSDFGEGDIVLLQNEISNLAYVIERAYEKKMCIILNPSPFNDAIRSLDLSKLSYVLLNEIEAGEFSSCDEPEDSLAFFREHYPELHVILTLGGNGSIYMDRACELRQCAFQTDVVDTTAAGDTFTGYFVAELSRGTACKQALKLASAAAAIAVSKKGAAPSIPCKDEVLARVKHLKPNGASGKHERLQRQIDAYVQENLKDATLEGLAKALSYSSVYTGNLVKKLTGRSFSAFVQNERCVAAARLLTETDLSVKAIIGAVGYENESFFRKIFEKKYGKTPFNYRKAKQ